MFWPNELAMIIIDALSITSEKGMGIAVLAVFYGYVMTAILMSLAIAKCISSEKRK